MIATVLPPVPTEGLGSDDVTPLSERIREQMLEVYHKTTGEVDVTYQMPGSDKEKSDKEKSHWAVVPYKQT